MKEIDVTAGIIRIGNSYLIAQRKESDKLGLLWEFPGGKIKKEESPEECLRRELKEEFNIDSKVGKLFCVSKYDYPDFRIKLMAYIIDSYEGDFEVSAHEQIKWVDIVELPGYKFAPADIPIVEKLLSEYNGFRSNKKTCF
ncbi:MAG: 8-oxo-dGTP diphosphatase MutT [Candidatus Woesearchaeota archaeon]